MRRKKKIIVLATLALAVIIAATVVPVVLINRDEDKTKKDTVVYADKLKALTNKSVKIMESGTITNKKQDILNAVKTLKDFPTIPDGSNISLEIKDDSTEITSAKEVDFILIVKKGGETSIEIKDFKVKSYTNQELVNHFASKIESLKIKSVKIDATSGTVTERKNDIISKIKELDDFPELVTSIEVEVKDDSAELTTAGVEITLIVKKGEELEKEIEGFSAKRSYSTQENVSAIENYFRNIKNTIFIPSSTSISSAADILTAVKASIGNNLTNEQKDLITSKSGQATSLVKGTKTNIIFEVNGKDTTLSITHRTSDIQKIMDYFDQKGKKEISIPYATTISNRVELNNAIQTALSIANPTVFTNVTKAYVTTASDYSDFSFTKGTAKDVKIQIKKGVDQEEFVILSVTHLLDNLAEVRAYFNKIKRKHLFIPSSTSISSAADILTALKTIIGGDLTNEQKDLITSKDGQPTSLVKGTRTPIIFKVGEEEFTLSITHRTPTAQKVIDYFDKVENRRIYIPNSTSISSRTDILNGVKDAIGDNLKEEEKDLINSKSDQPAQRRGGPLLPKGEETEIIFEVDGEDVTLSICHRTNDAQKVIDYFAEEENRKIFIPESTSISSAADILNAVKATIGTKLSNEQKDLIISKTGEATSLTKGTKTDITFEVDGEDVTLSITQRTSDAQGAIDYFAEEENRKIFIPESTSISSAAELLTAVKDAIGTKLSNEQKALIISKANEATSLTKGDKTDITFEVDGEDVTLSITQRTSDSEGAIDYFAKEENRKIFIPESTSISSAADILTAVKDAIGTKLSNEQKALIISKANEATSLTKGEETDITFEVDGEDVTLSITQRTSDAQGAIDYFAEEENRKIFIPESTSISSAADILTAVKDAIGTKLSNEQKALIISKANEATSLTKGTKTDITFEVDGEDVTLSITQRTSDAQEAIDYFAEEENRKIFIPESTSISSAAELLTAVKDAIGTKLSNEQKALIISKANEATSLTKGEETDITFEVDGEDVTLSITQRTSDAQGAIDYFAEEENRKIFIPESTSISSAADILTAVKDAIGTKLSNEQKALIISKANEATSLTKGEETDITFEVDGEDVTLSITQRTSDAQGAIDYFAEEENRKIFIPESTSISSAADILTAVKATIGTKLSNEQKALIISKANEATSLTKGEETDITFEVDGEDVTLSITQRTSDAQSVIDYFAIEANKKISIPESTSISSAAELLTAVKDAIGDELTEAQKALITSKDGEDTSLTKGDKTDITFEVDGEEVTLSISYGMTTTSYFAEEENRKIFLPYLTPNILKAGKLLKLVKTAIGDELTEAQKASITLKDNKDYYAYYGILSPAIFQIDGEDVTLSITQRGKEHQDMIDYLVNRKNKQIFIPYNIDISTAGGGGIANAIQFSVFQPDKINSGLLVPKKGQNNSSLVKGKKTNIIFKVVGEDITLSVTQRTSDAQSVIDYFAIEGNKTIFIPESTSISSAAELLAAVKVAIGEGLNNEQKALITSKDGEVTPLTKGTKIDITFEVDGEDVTLSITQRTSDAQGAIDYFAEVENRKISIPESTSISSAAELLAAVKVAIGTKLSNEQKALITSKDGEDTSLTKGTKIDITFEVDGEDVTLSITQRTSK